MQVAKPLYKLILERTHPKSRIPLKGIQNVKKLFIGSKNCVPLHQFLAYADFEKPFKLHTDVSVLGLGAGLYEVQDGIGKVISYANRSLLKSEMKYPLHKLEFLCLKWAITEQFHEYLYGNIFDIYTDNNPLTYVLTTAKWDAMEH